MFIDRAVDTPGHVKYLADEFNAVQKQYLSTCLRMRSMPEVDNIEIKRMHVYARTDKGEVSFSENISVY